MRGAKSNALFLRRANWNRICPCVALVIRAMLGLSASLRQLRGQLLQVPLFSATAVKSEVPTRSVPRRSRVSGKFWWRFGVPTPNDFEHFIEDADALHQLCAEVLSANNTDSTFLSIDNALLKRTP
jgi:hypothetical protein